MKRLHQLDGLLLAVNKPTGILSGDIVDFLKHALTYWHQQDLNWTRNLLPAPSVADLKPIIPDDDKNENQKEEAEDITKENKGENAQKRTRRHWPCKDVKVGHGGTLDPLASGVLVLAIGSATKSLQYFLTGNHCRKVYIATGKFGSSTDTFDSTGKVLSELPYAHVVHDMVEEKLRSFVGEIQQRPPIYSALRVNGQRMYDLARSGEQVERPPPRPVHVYNVQLLDFSQQDGQFRLRIECGGGTYIRSIIHDLGESLGTAAHMTDLIRSRQGVFALEEELEMKQDVGDGGGVGGVGVLQIEDLLDFQTLRDYMSKNTQLVDAYLGPIKRQFELEKKVEKGKRKRMDGPEGVEVKQQKLEESTVVSKSTSVEKSDDITVKNREEDEKNDVATTQDAKP